MRMSILANSSGGAVAILAEGQKILVTGERIRPTTIALLASQGFTDVTVGGEVNAAVVSTGDEVVTPGRKLDRGQIYDSNSVLLRALLQNCGACVKSVEHCPDERERLIEAIQRGIKSHILVITGGVSVGEHDLVAGGVTHAGSARSTSGASRLNQGNHFSSAKRVAVLYSVCQEILCPRL